MMIDYAPMPPVTFIPPVPQRKAKGMLIAQLATIGLLFVAATLFAVLYVLADGDRDDANSTLAHRRTELVEVRKDVTGIGAELTAADERNTDLKDENTGLQTCVDAVHHYLWDNLVDLERSTALDRMFDVCQ